MARRLAALVPFYEYDEAQLLPLRRRAGRGRGAAPRRLRCGLPALYRQRFAEDASALTARGRATASPTCSSPPPTACRSSTAASCASTCRPAPSCSRPTGVTVTDLDGNRFYDLTGSYGVNVFGYDFYKECIDARRRARARARPGARRLPSGRSPYNVRRLREISGLDEVSFHMSGTEAVMQAVRLARYHTGRSHLVRFCGAYHGWWGDVQPGVGNPAAGARDLHARRTCPRTRCACCARGATSPACWSTRCRRCTRTRNAPGDSRAGRQRRAARTSTAPPTPPGCKQLRAVCTRARHRADLRRGVRRLPARARRRAGVLRRARRHGHLRQDARRRPAGRRASAAART